MAKCCLQGRSLLHRFNRKPPIHWNKNASKEGSKQTRTWRSERQILASKSHNPQHAPAGMRQQYISTAPRAAAGRKKELSMFPSAKPGNQVHSSEKSNPGGSRDTWTDETAFDVKNENARLKRGDRQDHASSYWGGTRKSRASVMKWKRSTAPSQNKSNVEESKNPN